MRSGLVLAAVLVLGARRAEACSCVEEDGAFVIKSGTTVPLNMRSFPWWGETSTRDGHALPAAELFRFEIVEAAGARRLPFTLVFAPTTFADPLHQPGMHELVLLQPQRPLVAGAHYRLTFRPPAPPLIPGGPPPEPVVDQIVDMIAGQEAIGAKTGAAVALETATVGPLRVVDRAGACSASIRAAQLPVTLALPTPAERWREALLYAVTVDGKPWRPANHLCNEIPHGRSWVEAGHERLFVRCQGRRSAGDLRPGPHVVAMTAWLPGTNIFFKAERSVSLSCR